MTDTDRMLAWLRATLDAAQADAEAAAKPGAGISPQDPVEFILAGQDITTAATEAAERHIRRHTPAAVLRRIAADRQLLELHAQAHECSSWDEVAGDFNTCQWVNEWETCSTVRLLAEGWGWTEETT